MGGKEDKFDRFDEMGQLPGGYDVSLARQKALEHAYDELPEKTGWLKGISLIWEIKSAKFDEDEDCYRVVVLGYPSEFDIESKAQWEYHIDAKGNLYPGTPMLVSKGKWITNLPKSVEESANLENTEIEKIRRGQEEVGQELEVTRENVHQNEEQRKIEEAARNQADKETLQREERKHIEEDKAKQLEEFRNELDPETRALVEKHNILFNGDQYLFQTYRYDKLRNAIEYAELVAKRYPEQSKEEQQRGTLSTKGEQQKIEEATYKQAEDERLRMEELERIEANRVKRLEEFRDELDTDSRALVEKHNITFNGDQYLFRTYRYNKLEDAVAYAELMAKKHSDSKG